MRITEDQLEQQWMTWFREGGYEYAYGPEIAHDVQYTAEVLV